MCAMRQLLAHKGCTIYSIGASHHSCVFMVPSSMNIADYCPDFGCARQFRQRRIQSAATPSTMHCKHCRVVAYLQDDNVGALLQVQTAKHHLRPLSLQTTRIARCTHMTTLYQRICRGRCAGSWVPPKQGKRICHDHLTESWDRFWKEQP